MAQRTTRVIKDNTKPVNIIKKTPESWDTPPKGSPTGTCKVCGCTFEQVYIGEQNRYTSFKNCPLCRRKKVEEAAPADVVTLNYTPFAAQQLFHESKARYRVLCCGNRFGKDYCTTQEGVRIFAQLLNENRWIHNPSLTPSVYWWIIAPTERLAKNNWKELKKAFPKEWVVDVSDSTMVMQTIGDGVIEVRSSYDPESLVGVGLDLVTITEAARIADFKRAWANIRARLDSPGRGLQSEKPPGATYGWGKAIINSSPLGKNDFYELFCYGQKNHDSYMSLYESWQFTTWENPSQAEMRYMPIETRHGTITYEQSLIDDMGEMLYRQNYLAEFLDNTVNVFKNFTENCVEYMPKEWSKEQKQAYIKEWQEPIPYETYTIGYDPAKGGGDTPAVVVRENGTGRIKRVVAMDELEWKQQWAKISELSRYYNNAIVAFGQTGHTTLETNLSDYGLRLIPLNENGGSNKADLVTNMVVVCEQKAMRVLHDGSNEVQLLINQFKDYSAINKGASVSYRNVKQPHDDFVSACYFAFYDYGQKKDILPCVGLMSGLKIARR